MKMQQRVLSTTLAFGLSLGGGLFQIEAAELALSKVPLFIKDGVDPNMIVTLDDSGSMSWAYVPDGISGTSSSRRFKSAAFNGMYYDPTIRYIPPKDEDGNSYSTTFNGAWEHGFLTAKGSRNLSNNYRPTRTFNPASSPSYANHSTGRYFGATTIDGVSYPAASEPTSTTNGSKAYYYLFDSSRTDCDGTLGDDDCYHLVYVGTVAGQFDMDNDGDLDGDDERQNFANWYSFYRVRVIATASAASLAFQAVNEDVRVAYQNLHKCNGFDADCRDYRNDTSYSYDSRLSAFTGTHRKNFYDWLAYAPASGGTPLRSATERAGALLTRNDKYGAYAQYPRSSVGTEFACRPSFHIAMTDGVWNGGISTSVGNADSTNITLPDGTAYESKAPFKDTSSDSLADIVFTQWANDARPDLEDNLPTYMPFTSGTEEEQYWNARNDPATWQHMTTFTLSLGLSGVLTNPQFYGDTFASREVSPGVFDGYQGIVDEDESWPGVGSNDSDNPYDLWHAAINGRGEFFGATDPNSLVNAFSSIIAGIQARERSASAVALDSAVINGLQYAYHASFDSSSWFGNLRAFELDADDFSVSADPVWNANERLGERDFSERNIRIARASDGRLIKFRWDKLNGAQRAALRLDISNNLESEEMGKRRVNYLRGEQQYESATGMRPRNGNLLGDIVHSSPLYVGSPVREGYDLLEGLSETAANSYATFKSTWASRPPRVYVGANDGMLHGFNARTGVEKFAFIPDSVFDRLRFLTYPGYTHEYYVDGPLATGDVFDGSQWRTILVGTLRSGGKSVFALDVTDPTSIKFLWEFTHADLGHVYARPEIVRLHNGEWGVILSNGYNSSNHKASLFVLNPVDGSIVRHLDTGEGSFADTNGLGTPTPVDLNGDLIVDYVYAGDLHGNLWRFDLVDASIDDSNTTIYEPVVGTAAAPAKSNGPEARWRIGYSGSPIFVATDEATPTPNRQPITSNVVVVPHETGTGVITLVGTGKYLEGSDAGADTSRYQSYYGIWDRYVMGQVSGTPSTVDRADLLQQKLSVSSEVSFQDLDENGDVVNEVENTVRKVSEYDIQWYTYNSGAAQLNHQGWYINFNEYAENDQGEPTGTPSNQGELLATDAIYLGGTTIFATSTPNNDPCEAGIERWVWGLDVQSGKRTTFSVFDFNNDGVIDREDQDADGSVYNSVKIEGFGAPAAVGEYVYLNQDTRPEETKVKPTVVGRKTWRKVR